MMLTYERNVLKAKVNTLLGSLLLGCVALWAAIFIWHAATGENFVVNAFAAVIYKETVPQQ
jgi:4-hydroxybenzoate polyprenyltransferase